MSFSELFTYMQQLMTTHEATFVASGLYIFRRLAIIIWVWFGIQVALRGKGFPMESFMDLMMTTAIGFSMLQFYSTSLHAFGDRSFSRLIVDQGAYLANYLNNGMVDQVADRLAGLFVGLETPGISSILNVLDVVRWIFTAGLVATAYAFMFVIISFGYWAVAVGILIGPIMIPFFIVPQLNYMFWGWLRALMQYSFYPVIGNAYVFVFGSFLIGYVDRMGTDLSGINQAKSFFTLFALLIGFTYGMVKTPSVANSYFSGKSGESAHPW